MILHSERERFAAPRTPSGARGSVAIGWVVAMLVMGTIIMLTMSVMTAQNANLSGLSKGLGTAIQAADAGLNQLVSDISNRRIDVLGTPMPLLRTYPVTVGDATVNVAVSLSYRVDGFGNVVQDLEGNSRFLADAVVTTGVVAVGSTTTKTISKRVQADLTVINLAGYCMFVTANHTLSGSGVTFDGPYHTNGTMALGGTPYVNALKLPSGAANPFFSSGYVAMTALSFVAYGATPTISSMYLGSNNNQAYLSNSGSYTVLATTAKASGTWFDKAHGGFVSEQRPIPFSTYYNQAQVIIQQSTLPAFRVNGASYSSANLTIDAGVNGQANVVKINLGALGTGSNEDVCQGLGNYESALGSAFGLIIYVEGPVGVYGRLPAATGALNTNKKVTVISTSTIEMLGDLLYSGDAYGAGQPSYSTTGPVPLAATSNPTNDGLALVCPGNIYVNPWRKTNTAFFANSTTVKYSGFLYSESGMIAQGSRSWKSGGSTTIAEVTYFGAQTKRNPGAYSGTFHILFDPTLSGNVSTIIPVGISFNSWREVSP